MRFIVKWNNGCWRVFDSVSYSDASIWSLEVDAKDRADWMNTGPGKGIKL
jgi:hypothetical protein